MLALTILIIIFVLGVINAIYQTRKRSRRQNMEEKSGCFFFFF